MSLRWPRLSVTSNGVGVRREVWTWERMMRLLFALTLMLAAAFAPVARAQELEYVGDETQTGAPVVFWPGGWNVILQRFDSERSVLLPQWVLLNPQQGRALTYDSARATADIREQLGLERRSGARARSGYRVAFVEPGDYVLVGLYQPNSNGYGSWIDGRCYPAGPVFRLAESDVSIFEAGDLLDQRSRPDADAAARIERQISFFAEGHPALTGRDVHLAQAVGFVDLPPQTMTRMQFIAVFVGVSVQLSNFCPAPGRLPVTAGPPG